MPYEFTLPFKKESSDEYQKNAYLLAKSTKSTALNLVEKSAPAHIAVVGYKDGSFTGATHFLSNKFFLQGISEAGQEKLQVIETFGKQQLLFFDQRMKAFNFRGLFVDAEDQEGGISNYWADAFRMFYENYLRGTKLVDNEMVAVLTVNNQMYTGYPTSLQLGIESQRPLLDTFNMTWAIIGTVSLPPLVDGVAIDATGIITHLNALSNMFKADSIDLDPTRTREIEDLNRQIKAAEDEIDRLTDLIVGITIVEPETDSSWLEYDQLRTSLEAEVTRLTSLRTRLAGK